VDWLRRILAVLFGSRYDDRDDDRRPAEALMADGSRDDAMPMNASGSPDERDEAGDNDDDAGGDDGGSDDGGGDDGGSDD